MKIFTAILLCSVVLINGCGGGSGSAPAPATENPPADTDLPAATMTKEDCVEILNVVVSNTPVILQNMDSPCDYYIQSDQDFRSDVTIQPGTVFLVSEGKSVVFSGTSLIAQGSAAEPILFTGEAATPGHWSGIVVRTRGPSLLEHVIVEYGGELSTPIVGDPSTAAAVQLASNDLTLTDITVSHSLGDGMSFIRSTLNEFSNNRFFANGGVGVEVPPEILSSLDAASDYSGEVLPNAKEGIKLRGLFLEIRSGESVSVPNLGAPIRLSTFSVSNGGALSIEPGARLAFVTESDPVLFNEVRVGGQFNASGTKEQPIRFEPADDSSRPWVSIRTLGSAVFKNVIINKGGAQPAVGASEVGAITVGTSSPAAGVSLAISDSTITNSQGWGIYCASEGFDVAATDVTFADNLLGNTSEGCGL